jgi:hypothetical protein
MKEKMYSISTLGDTQQQWITVGESGSLWGGYNGNGIKGL